MIWGSLFAAADARVGVRFSFVSSPTWSLKRTQFAGCDASGKACKALAFNAAAEKKSATLAQVNNFNQTSLLCRAYQDKSGKMNVVYATLLGATDTRDDMKMHIGAWQTCLGAFGQFLQDPTGYLAAAP